MYNAVNNVPNQVGELKKDFEGNATAARVCFFDVASCQHSNATDLPGTASSCIVPMR